VKHTCRSSVLNDSVMMIESDRDAAASKMGGTFFESVDQSLQRYVDQGRADEPVVSLCEPI
jgi:hypothetical protein